MIAPEAIYQVFIRSFADGNGDGIGDFKGLTAKLDYITELGCDTLWLMPFNPSPSYHKYDVTDYFGIDPEYGSIQDFETFLAAAHAKGLKIIMDLVVNHCSQKHEWFQKALTNDSQFRDYFIWRPKNTFKNKQERRKRKSGDSDNTIIWHEIGDDNDLFYAYFWDGMPNLNYDNPAVRSEVFRIGQFWLNKGIDGFRLDAAMHLYPDERIDDTVAFWIEFKAKMHEIKPEVFLVGEVWKDLKTQSKFHECFSSLFSFDLSYSILESVKRGHIASAHVAKDAWKAEDRGSPVDIFNEGLSSEQHFIQSTFLSNHDQDRVLSFLKNHTHKAKLAASILLTLPGIPVIYYGEEIGMKGKKPDEYIREPYPWGDEYETKWMNRRYNINPQKELFNCYRQLLNVRLNISAFNDSLVVPQVSEDPSILSYYIISEDRKLLVIHNLSDQDKTLKQPGYGSPIFYTYGLENLRIIESFTLRAFGSLMFDNSTP